MSTELESLPILYHRLTPEPITRLQLEEFCDAVKVILRDPEPEKPKDPEKTSADCN